MGNLKSKFSADKQEAIEKDKQAWTVAVKDKQAESFVPDYPSTDDEHGGVTFQVTKGLAVESVPDYPSTVDEHGGVTFQVTKGLAVESKRLETQKALAKIGVKTILDLGACYPEAEKVQVLTQGHKNGFINAAVTAWSFHYPLSLAPQHFWLLILQAIATHVEQNAEEVRYKWVSHEGKKELLVECPGFVMGQTNDWASVIDDRPDSFSNQINKNIVEGLEQELVPEFSTLTPQENIAIKVTVMDACKSFFSYRCSTRCGFPSVKLEGSDQDWINLRDQAKNLIEKRCTKKFSQDWSLALFPILDKFIEERKKAKANEPIDHVLWNSMIKRGARGGSGARTWFSGWFNIFFPYINKRWNHYCEPYSTDQDYTKEGRLMANGPDVSDFPKGLAEAPVIWDYHGTDIDLEFKSGFIGATQDKETGMMRAEVGWWIQKKDEMDAIKYRFSDEY